MPIFSYKATDSAGKVFSDTVEAEDERAVVALLQDAGHIPIRVSRSDSLKPSLSWNLDVKNLFQRIAVRDVMLFTQDLTALLESGLPVDRSLKILVDAAESDLFREIVKDILKSIEGGSDLSGAMAKHPGAFSDFYVNMVRAGEAGGVLEAVLARLGLFLETSQELKEYIKSALVYPVFLLFVGGLSIIILMTFVIPKFSMIFQDMGGAIPWSTALLLGMSAFLSAYWWVILIAMTGAGFVIYRYIRTPMGREYLDRISLKIPIVGDLVRKVEIARVSRTLGTLINSGVPILEALRLVKDIVGNRQVARAMDDVHGRVKEGEELSSPLMETRMFPSLAIQMIRVGEETGRLSEMLLRVADNYEKAVRNAVKRAISLFEPTMILVMGVVVGSIVVSMLMAIFSMNDISF